VNVGRTSAIVSGIVAAANGIVAAENDVVANAEVVVAIVDGVQAIPCRVRATSRGMIANQFVSIGVAEEPVVLVVALVDSVRFRGQRSSQHGPHRRAEVRGARWVAPGAQGVGDLARRLRLARGRQVARGRLVEGGEAGATVGSIPIACSRAAIARSTRDSSIESRAFSSRSPASTSATLSIHTSIVECATTVAI
jgi:hypothetical protein